MSLTGARVVVVGASAGIGRAFTRHAVKAGADVMISARRAETLDEVVAEAGSGTAIVADVADAADRTRLVAEAIAALGEIDLLLYAVGSARLRPLDMSDPSLWHQVFDTNVTAFNELVREALPSMATNGAVAALSSETATMARFGLAHYAASKAALETSLQAWRVEHPELRWSCVRVGGTFPTEFGDAFDPALLGPALDSWTRHGLMQEALMDPDEVGGALTGILGAALAYPGVSIDELILRSPSPIAGSSR